MCIRDRLQPVLEARPVQQAGERVVLGAKRQLPVQLALFNACLLYTSDAADDLLCVDLGGRRIINKKTYVSDGAQFTIQLSDNVPMPMPTRE